MPALISRMARSAGLASRSSTIRAIRSPAPDDASVAVAGRRPRRSGPSRPPPVRRWRSTSVSERFGRQAAARRPKAARACPSRSSQARFRRLQRVGGSELWLLDHKAESDCRDRAAPDALPGDRRRPSSTRDEAHGGRKHVVDHRRARRRGAAPSAAPTSSACPCRRQGPRRERRSSPCRLSRLIWCGTAVRSGPEPAVGDAGVLSAASSAARNARRRAAARGRGRAGQARGSRGSARWRVRGGRSLRRAHRAGRGRPPACRARGRCPDPRREPGAGARSPRRTCRR